MTIIIEKVVLSRKGFDSGKKAGGDYSRVDPATGKYVVVPIPETSPKTNEFYRYEEFGVKSDHFPGKGISNLRDLIINAGMNQSALESPGFAHFDPWLGPCPWMEINDPLNPGIGAFGQQGPPLGHLKKQKVLEDIDKGRLFLFYSRFKPLRTSETGKQKIEIGPLGAYFIYGWLKIGSIIDTRDGLDPDVDKALRDKKHPHYCSLEIGKNEIFLGAKLLYEDEKIPGFGYFRELTPNLMLSKLGDKPTIWELPSFFHRDFEHKNERPTYLKDKIWVNNEDSGKTTMTELKGYGQEFVFDTSEDPKGLESWLLTMFSNNAMYGA